MGDQAPRLSVIIPFWPKKEYHQGYLERCVRTLRGHDELIVVVNDGIGFAAAVNHGLRLARGEYIAVINRDIQLERGSLLDLARPNSIVSPTLNGDSQKFWGCCWVMDRRVYETIGLLDERFRIGYFEDDDYIIRAVRAGVVLECNPAVEIVSEGGVTMRTVDSHNQIFMENKNRFIEKWGAEPKDIPGHPHYDKHPHP